jgi:hypothetical protein
VSTAWLRVGQHTAAATIICSINTRARSSALPLPRFGSIACRELWMWSDESGNGIGLDVTMKEAYANGVGDGAITFERSSTLRDFPMT